MSPRRKRKASPNSECTTTKTDFSRDLPKLNPGKLPEPYFVFETTKNGKVAPARDVEVDKVENLASRSTKTASQQYLPAPPPPPPEVGKSGKPLTKKEKKAVRFFHRPDRYQLTLLGPQLKTKTAGKDWFDLPAPAEADLPRLYREYEALRLRNHLDPKRFYRKDEGEGKGIKGLPKYFAVRNSPLNPNKHDRLFRSRGRLGRSYQQRLPLANRQAVTSHVQNANVR